tara:strand:- start:2352 stop:2546 length:195 start_codon:yes stop_codon:yes gene_type:complete
MIRVGSVVTEAETDLAWCMFPGQTGVIVGSADKEMDLPSCGRFWTVCFGEELGVFLDEDLEVIK